MSQGYQVCYDSGGGITNYTVQLTSYSFDK